jgi:cell division protein FtsN
VRTAKKAPAAKRAAGAATPAKDTTRWVVSCPEFTTTELPRETAERRRADIEKSGACMYDHDVRQVAP